MFEVKAIIRRERLDDVVHALHEVPEIPGLTVSTVRGFGKRGLGGAIEYGETEMVKLETVVPDGLLPRVVETIQTAAHTGRAGDGKIFVIRIDDAVQIRSGAHGSEAL